VRAAEAFGTARTYASTVRNTWLSMMAETTSAIDPRLDTQTALDALLDIIDEQHRGGWTTYAWSGAWYVPGLLLDLDRTETAAFAAGACCTSGTQPMFTALPEALANLDGPGDSRLHHRFRQGGNQNLPTIIRVARHPSSLPPLL
jgi:hypothetical protein